MKGKYQAAFIIPIGANKVLGEDGWEFDADGSLSVEIKNYLIKELELTLLESYLGIDAYVNDNIKMSVINDESNRIESIAFQLYGNALDTLLNVIQAKNVVYDLELFVPGMEALN